MDDSKIGRSPAALGLISADTGQLGFSMGSEPKTGALLACLAANKPGGQFLELGTGTGLSAAWILLGMDADSALISVDNDETAQAVAVKHLGGDKRFTAVCASGKDWLETNKNIRFDFIFADAWPGKFIQLDKALGLLKEGGIYIVDDLLPQENWPEGHAASVGSLIDELESRPGFSTVRINWASGLMLVVRNSA